MTGVGIADAIAGRRCKVKHHIRLPGKDVHAVGEAQITVNYIDAQRTCNPGAFGTANQGTDRVSINQVFCHAFANVAKADNKYSG